MSHYNPLIPNPDFKNEAASKCVQKRRSRVANCFDRLQRVLQLAIDENSTTAIFRFDLRFPVIGVEQDTATISRFLESLEADVSEVGRAQNSSPCYVWLKEWDHSHLWHFHVCIFTNGDVFTSGSKPLCHPDNRSSTLAEREATKNMVDRLKRAWANALGVNLGEAAGLVSFPGKPVFHLDAGSPVLLIKFKEQLNRLCDLAKSDANRYGDGSVWFGCSR